KDSGGLRNASARNKRLWSATKLGRVSDMKAILEPGDLPTASEDFANDYKNGSTIFGDDDEQGQFLSANNSYMNGAISEQSTQEPIRATNLPETPSLAHVFPFQTWV